MNHPTDRLTHVRIELRNRRWNELEDRLDSFLDSCTGEGLSARQCLIENDSHREQIRGWSDVPHRGLLGGHVLERSLLSGYGLGPCQVYDTEVDDLCAVILHHEDV